MRLKDWPCQAIPRNWPVWEIRKSSIVSITAGRFRSRSILRIPGGLVRRARFEAVVGLHAPSQIRSYSQRRFLAPTVVYSANDSARVDYNQLGRDVDLVC